MLHGRFALSVLALLMKNIPFEPKHFTPIMLAYEGLTCIKVNPTMPVNSVRELIDDIARNPGKLS